MAVNPNTASQATATAARVVCQHERGILAKTVALKAAHTFPDESLPLRAGADDMLPVASSRLLQPAAAASLWCGVGGLMRVGVLLCSFKSNMLFKLLAQAGSSLESTHQIQILVGSTRSTAVLKASKHTLTIQH